MVIDCSILALMPTLQTLAVAVLVLQTTTAWTWVIAADVWLGDNRLAWLWGRSSALWHGTCRIRTIGQCRTHLCVAGLHTAEILATLGSGGLELVTRVLWSLCFAITLCWWWGWDMQLATHQDAYGLVVHLGDHALEDAVTLYLVDEKWILLLVVGILYGLLQVVQVAEVLLPCLVDDVQDDDLHEGLDDVVSVGVGGLL